MTDKLFTAIAREHLRIAKLDDTFTDRDFHEVAVWSVRAALAAAYEAGFATGNKAGRKCTASSKQGRTP
jgi:hypothetical protein